jgi:hypothetical protein
MVHCHTIHPTAPQLNSQSTSQAERYRMPTWRHYRPLPTRARRLGIKLESGNGTTKYTVAYLQFSGRGLYVLPRGRDGLA